MDQLRRFSAWARQLDERVLGPGGWLPAGTSYAEYQRALARGSASPAWVQIVRVLLVALLLVLERWGGDNTWGVFLIVPIVTLFGMLTFRIDRDIRIAARDRFNDSR